ncbi:vhs domain containing protein [Grosmannia clavigera kw1407]|uniref:Vhs domain containing protein n=1 Tax=Grosmannia clavigera (strain kw1407 / UAMH 11150) TaxID=655863 RepID=F0XEH8_GROCL|nr:vhs domain containing protein [Grosmannia clavigera kw1407]EFX04493.1 vhs domain containing protein [Grosmannia clavigera kw1407]
MEAASARYAARDRWGELAHPAPSQLLRFVQSACSPENYEPNLALNLEIADLINSKKGTAPREAANAIVGYVNHRNPNVALLALNLLDICVKNCGYPFHLQISTKEFLNELVRRFPERPPVRPTRVQLKILGAIEEWRGTICETSRYKEDLGFVRDMHRLLSYKGYTFPEVRREDAAVLNPSDNLKSVEEMEEEEREAQSAKLQELIRRGTPEDLQEANRLMKVMAGYDTRSKVDYRAKAAEDVGKIQKKAALLEERLAAFQEGDTMTDGDVFDELASALSSAQPKIQKMCEEESDDHTAVARLLEINDSIHRTVERYKLLKKGDMAAAQKIAQGGPVPARNGSRRADGKKPQPAVPELSLIDFDGDSSADQQPPSQPPTNGSSSRPLGIENDLLGLSFGDPSAGGIALGFGENSNVPGPALLSSVMQSNSARGPLGSPSPPPPMTSSPQPVYQSSAFAPPKAAAADPFAALGLGLGSLSSPSSVHVASPAPGGNDDDEWSFSSALPPETPAKPQEHRITVGNGAVKIEVVARRSPETPQAISFMFAFSNNTAQPISDMHFQAAVTRGYELKMQPQTGRSLAPQQSRGIAQTMEVWHAHDRTSKVETIKLRWRISCKVGGDETKTDMGEVPEFGLA